MVHPKFRDGRDHMYGCNCPRCRTGANKHWIIPIALIALGWFLAQFGRTYFPNIDALAIGSGILVIGVIWTIVYAAIRQRYWVIGLALILFGLIFPSIVAYVLKVDLMIGTFFPTAEGVVINTIATGIMIIGILFLAAYGIRAFIRFISKYISL